MSRYPDNFEDAATALQDARTGIYLGARYGLTPHTLIAADVAQDVLGFEPMTDDRRPLNQFAEEIERRYGREHLLDRIGAGFSRLDKIADETLAELNLVSRLGKGRVFITGCYASTVSQRLGDDAIVVPDDADEGVSRLVPGRLDLASVAMLHGSQSSLGSLLLTRRDVDNFVQRRTQLAAALREFLKRKFVVLGFDRYHDETFDTRCWEVSRGLGQSQRPVYVVDPRDWSDVSADWPRAALRHVKMAPRSFIEAVLALIAKGPGGPTSGPGDDPPPAGDDRPSPGADPARSDPDPPDNGPIPPDDDGDEPSGGPPPPPAGATRRVFISTIDGRRFEANATGTTRVGDLTRRFIRQFVLGEDGAAGDRRVAVDHVGSDGDGDATRLREDQTLDEAGVQDGDEVRVLLDHVAGAGAVDPRRRLKALREVVVELERLAKRDDRIKVEPEDRELPERYTVHISCGGWEPGGTIYEPPMRTECQVVELSYPAEFPNVAPNVCWKSPCFHPNVEPKEGHVCLGDIGEFYTPLFGADDLVLKLIEVSEYRNYELRGVLNADAAIWAQFNVDTIISHGGWAYQARLGEDEELVRSEHDGAAVSFKEISSLRGSGRRRSAQ